MRRFAIAIVVLFLAAVPAYAQEVPPALVGRVSVVAGELAFHMAGETQWSKAAVNYPVATGATYWTAPQARAEFRIGPQTLGLSSDTALDIVQLDEQVMRLALKQGRINLHLRELGEGNSVQIDLPRGGVWLLQPGIYDIAAGTAAEPSRIAVFEGGARFVGGRTEIGIKTGDVAVIGGAETLTASLERVAPDEFSQWCRERDYDHRGLAATRHVSPRMTGYEELDAHGTWRTVRDHGEVWYPKSLPAGWVPYRDGHWSWVQPWGWNWVDDQPWGFAPSHYGRWAHLDGGWGWLPGRSAARPVYAPALVAFIDNPAMIVASRGPAVGWFPLGPSEPYWPGYTMNPGYIRAINAGIVRDPERLERATAGPPLINRGAMTVVPQRAFIRAERVERAAMRVSERAAQRAAIAAMPPGFRGERPGRDRPGGPAEVTGAPGAGRQHFIGAPGGAPGGTPGRDRSAAQPGPRFAAPHEAQQRAHERGQRGAEGRDGHPGRPHFGAPHEAQQKAHERAQRGGGGHDPRQGRPHFAAPHQAQQKAHERAQRGGGGHDPRQGRPHFAAPHQAQQKAHERAQRGGGHDPRQNRPHSAAPHQAQQKDHERAQRGGGHDPRQGRPHFAAPHQAQQKAHERAQRGGHHGGGRDPGGEAHSRGNGGGKGHPGGGGKGEGRGKDK